LDIIAWRIQFLQLKGSVRHFGKYRRLTLSA
jgi:hypothetical protein